MSIDHDPFCCPTGKIIDAWVEPDGTELALFARFHVEDEVATTTHALSSTELVHIAFEDHPKPFLTRNSNPCEKQKLTISADPANFPDYSDFVHFVDRIKEIDGDVEFGHMGRFSFTPEPLIQFVVEHPALSAALAFVIGRSSNFVTYTLDAALKRVADEIGEQVGNIVITAWKEFHSSSNPDHRRTLLEVILSGELEIVLLFRQEREDAPEGLYLANLVEEMEKYGDLLRDADSVTFSYRGRGEWRLEYLTTKVGGVIGSKNCYERTIRMRNAIMRRED